VAVLYAALFDAVAAHARLGLDVVVDVGLHESFATPLAVRADCARRLADLPVLVVGVRCPVEVIWQRRLASWGQEPATADAAVRAAVERWQDAVHAGMPYDLEVDTSRTDPLACVERIAGRVREGPPGTALERLRRVRGG
jgi:chloramphenicol 3-O phosphotransferase